MTTVNQPTDEDRATANEVRLHLPAGPQLLNLARVTAAAAAAQLDFSYEEVEDLRLAVDELCFSLIGTEDVPGRLVLTYLFEGDTVEVEASLEGADGGGELLSTDLSQRVLDALVDEHGTGRRRGGELRAWLRKRRRVPNP